LTTIEREVYQWGFIGIQLGLKEQAMSESVVKFSVIDLRACVPEGITLQWQGKELSSGALHIQIDDGSDANNEGVLDYGSRRAEARLQVLLSFPDFASTLEALGADPELARPIQGVIHSEGEIRDDHAFVLSGPCELADHPLLNKAETRAAILSGT